MRRQLGHDGLELYGVSRICERRGDVKRARKLYEQLAIYYEHEAREPRRALAIAREALAQLRRANQVGTITPATYRKTKAQFEHRLVRVERKAGRTLLDTFDA